MTQLEQLLTILLSSLKGGDLPLKTTVDGSELNLCYNDTTKRIEVYRNSASNSVLEWSKYEGDFNSGNGILTLGDVDGTVKIEINQNTGIVNIKDLTASGEILADTFTAVSEIVSQGDLSIEGDFNILNGVGSARVEYNGLTNILLTLPETDGELALKTDIPNLDDWVSVQTGVGETIVSIGDYNNSSGGTKVVVNDEDQEIILKANSGVMANSDFICNFSFKAKSGVQITTPFNLNQVSLFNNLLTSPRNVQFPDKNGTIAYLSDLPGTSDFVDKVSNESVGGEKTFTDLSLFDLGIQMTNNNTSSIANASRAGVYQNVNNRLQFHNTTDNVLQARNWVFNSDNLTVNKRVYDLPDEDAQLATLNSTPNWSGWAQYGDSQYTSASPLVTSQGSTSVIDLDGLSNTVKSQLPVGVSDLYDTATSKILPVNIGDGYSLSLSYKASNTSNNGDFTIFIDIGGSFTRIFPDVKRTPRGQNVAHEFVTSLNYYTLGTFLANGGFIKIESGTGATSLYDISLQIHKTHNAR